MIVKYCIFSDFPFVFYSELIAFAQLFQILYIEGSCVKMPSELKLRKNKAEVNSGIRMVIRC